MRAANSDRPTRVLIVRGHQATPWESRPWELLPERFDVSYLRTRSNLFDTSGIGLRPVRARALRDFMPPGRIGDMATGLIGDRYIRADACFQDADIVHAAELHFWFTADAARRKHRHNYRLIATAWETIPLLTAYRNRSARRYRQEVLPAVDLFLATTERARHALLFEGVPPERIEVCPPGIDLTRFSVSSATPRLSQHLILSPGRLVWEKGHQDVIRAIAALHHGIVGDGTHRPRLLIVGSGPEEKRLQAHALELGVAEAVEIRRFVPYDQMPSLYAQASCMVLASLPMTYPLPPLSGPRIFWEEQFGMVLAEAMAAGLPIVASQSGAISEVVGDSATYFYPGDWAGLAQKLAHGPLSTPPATRIEHPSERVEKYSTEAAAAVLTRAYDGVVAG